MRQLNCHPEIHCLREPFNPNNHQALYRARDIPSLDDALRAIWKTHNGIKHVWDPSGWPFGANEELNKHLLRQRTHRVLYLNRRNTLRRLVSQHMSWQTKVWGTFAPSERQRVLEFKFQALDIESLRSKLRSEATTVAHYGQILRESGAEFLELWYEDFFDLALKASDRAEFYNRLVVFLGEAPSQTGGYWRESRSSLILTIPGSIRL